jgi:hypothetical protein
MLAEADARLHSNAGTSQIGCGNMRVRRTKRENIGKID